MFKQTKKSKAKRVLIGYTGSYISGWARSHRRHEIQAALKKEPSSKKWLAKKRKLEADEKRNKPIPVYATPQEIQQTRKLRRLMDVDVFLDN